ncbi:MAG: hypothetical protein JXB05_00430 [Myxococcaceae bacterium]|nr:hypothetical protein [Myxococcaceae bacterium]
MASDEWNKSDDFVLHLFSATPVMARGFEGLEQVLGAIESMAAELRPDRIRLARRTRKYSRQVLRERLHEAYLGDVFHIMLSRAKSPEIMLTLASSEYESGVRSVLSLWVTPFGFFSEPGHSERRAEHIISFVRELSSRLPLSYGLGHSLADLDKSSDPDASDVRSPPRIQEAFWLNVYGPQLVEQVGRQRMLSTPAFHLEELPGGAVLWLTRPTPADFASEEARLAQARAMVHLRQEWSLDSTLAALRQRSLEFTPIPMEFDADVADILRMEVDFQGLIGGQRQNVERFNRYRPPPVSEWMAASQAPPPDVEDVQAAIDTYEGLYAEQLIALFHEEEPLVLKDSVEALPRMDFRLWHYGWPGRLSDEQREILVRALGGWLGRYLVYFLGGRWVPRRKVEESAVLVGERAWLPFLRARHSLQGPEAPLDYSCSQFFRVAQRLAGKAVGSA